MGPEVNSLGWVTERSGGGPKTARMTGEGALLGTQVNIYVQQKHFNYF